MNCSLFVLPACHSEYVVLFVPLEALKRQRKWFHPEANRAVGVLSLFGSASPLCASPRLDLLAVSSNFALGNLSYITHVLLHFMFYVSGVVCHVSCVMCNVSSIMNDVLCIFYVRCFSCVTYSASCTMCHV